MHRRENVQPAGGENEGDTTDGTLFVTGTIAGVDGSRTGALPEPGSVVVVAPAIVVETFDLVE